MKIVGVNLSSEYVSNSRIAEVLNQKLLEAVKTLDTRTFASFRDDEDIYERYYARPIFTKPSMLLAECSPPTPADDLESYRESAEHYQSILQEIIDTFHPHNLDMGAYARSVNSYSEFLNSLPKEFCINDSTRAEFDDMSNSISNTNRIAKQGISILESNFGRYVTEASDLLDNVKLESRKVSPQSRDFRAVLEALSVWQDYSDDYQLEVWNLSPTIDAFNVKLQRKLSDASVSFEAALERIELNVESESNRFIDSHSECKKSFDHWNNKDGHEGYSMYLFQLRYVNDNLIPDFNEFINKVPSTERVTNAITSAQSAINSMMTIYNSFPTFTQLPASSNTFPYLSYWSASRNFGNEQIIEVVRKACVKYYNDTNRKLYIGDMSYRHNGKAKPHKSHRNGTDADVDPVEVGNIPNHDKDLALAAAKRFLSAGAITIFYGDHGIVDEANQWAKDNNITGRLVFEADHKRHFHLRI